MFDSSLPSNYMSYFLCVYLRIVVSNTYCVFVLFSFVLCTLCCQFLWIVLFWLPLRYCLTFIHHAFRWNNANLKLNNNQSIKHYPFLYCATSTLFIVCKFVLVTNTVDLVLNNNQLIWCNNFTFLFYSNRVLFLHWKGNKSVIRFLPIVLVSNIVLGMVVCGPLQGKIIRTHAVHNATFLHTRCNMCNHKYSWHTVHLT